MMSQEQATTGRTASTNMATNIDLFSLITSEELLSTVIRYSPSFYFTLLEEEQAQGSEVIYLVC
jgi:hypothetical protein